MAFFLLFLRNKFSRLVYFRSIKGLERSYRPRGREHDAEEEAEWTRGGGRCDNDCEEKLRHGDNANDR